jgi:uncharacterized protein (UPF0254 family)
MKLLQAQMIEKRIYCDVFCMCFIVVVSNDIQAIYEKYNVKFNGVGGTALMDTGEILIILGNVNYSIVHEIEHAVSLCWKQCQIKKKQGIDEAHAYMSQWLYNKVASFVKKNGYKL